MKILLNCFISHFSKKSIMAVLIGKYIDQSFPLKVKPMIIKTSSSSMIFEFA